ncbi:CBS domain-containing protein, partial [Brevibacterium sp. SIMBA_078]
VTVTTQTPIQDVAFLMTQESVSSVLVTDIEKQISDDPEEDDGQVVGIITDRDIRTKVVAQGLTFDTPAKEVMTSGLVLLD